MMKKTFIGALTAAAAFFALCCNADSAAQELRIMSYNIYHGEGADKKLDLPRIASIIARQRPDYVGLQEVDSATLRSKGVDQAGELGRLLGMHAEFAQAIPFQGGGYGVALLSREKPVSVRRIALPGKEPRVLLLCEFDDCWVGNMHLDLNGEARLESTRAVRAIASKLTATKPLFIVGDWNDEFESKPLSEMREYLTVLSKLNCRTYHGFKKHPADDEYCIDYIAVDRVHAPKFVVKEAYVVAEPTASDHNPIVVSVSPASAEGAAGLPTAIFSEDFEQGSRRWDLPSGQWKVVDGAGLDGSRALVLEYAEGEIPKWLERNEMVPVEPGEAYRIEAWVKDDEFKAKDRPVSVSFAVYDAKNNLIRGAGAGTMRISDNIVRKDGFRRVEGTTRPLPMKAVKGRFYIWAKEGSHGRVAFDGFKIYPVAVNALESLCCSAYRGEASDGEVGFSAGYAVNEFKHDVKKLRVELCYRAPEGEKTVIGELSDGVATVKLPVESFAFGTNRVSMSLMEGGKTLGRLSCDFARVEKLPERRVRFDEFGRTILDGKPFFPLGMYWNDVNAADLAVYTNTVFNCLMPYKRPDEKKMDMCAAAGIKVIYPICGFYEIMASTNVKKAARFRADYIDGLVEKFRSHPATLAWYLADELPTLYVKHLEERRRMCHRLDPDHPTWVCINAPAVVRTLVNGYDALGMDPYPVGSPWGTGDLAMASDWALKARRGMYGYRPMWQIPQAFDWSVYVRKTYAGQDKNWRKPAGMRMPTRGEMRSMTWQAIAAGANGIVYYYFEDAYRRGATKEESARRWADVCAVAREVKEKESIVLSEPGPEVSHDSGAAVVCRSWKAEDGSVHLLACNTTGKTVDAKVRAGRMNVALSLSPYGVKWVKE